MLEFSVGVKETWSEDDSS